MPRYLGVVLSVSDRIRGRLLDLEVRAPNNQVRAEQRRHAIGQFRAAADPAHRAVVEMAVMIVQIRVGGSWSDDLLVDLSPRLIHLGRGQQCVRSDDTVTVIGFHLSIAQGKAEAVDIW